jgi:hypothetical protein
MSDPASQPTNGPRSATSGTSTAGVGASPGGPNRLRRGLAARLSVLLGPRSEERRGRGELRFIEMALLVLVGIVLAVATANDDRRSVHIGTRLAADLEGWRATTGVWFHNPFIEQDIKAYTTRDVVCADLVKGKPEGHPQHPQVCLIFTGPVHDGRRTPRGGYYLEARGTDVHEPVLDYPEYRYACFGSAVYEHLCRLSTPPSGFPTRPYAVGGV